MLGYPPPGLTRGGTHWLGYSPCLDLAGVPTGWGTPPAWTWLGYPPPQCGQTDGWMDGQTRVKTLPSRRTTYAVGKCCYDMY